MNKERMRKVMITNQNDKPYYLIYREADDGKKEFRGCVLSDEIIARSVADKLNEQEAEE